MKKIIQILVFITLSRGLFAQVHYVPQTFSTPYGNITTHQAVYTPMYYGNYGGQVNLKYEFTVTLKNDSVLTFKSRMESENKKMYIVQKNGKVKRKIFANETKELYAYNVNYGRLKGIVADSCWYFKAHKGAINSYTVIPNNNKDMAAAIQEGEDGPIIALTKKNLEAMTGNDDPKIVKWLSKYKYSKVISYYNEQQKKNQTESK
jgi:hypothetical protein